jgi:excinuclease UvrABC helicase subunit UvrB
MMDFLPRLILVLDEFTWHSQIRVCIMATARKGTLVDYGFQLPWLWITAADL